MKRLGLVAIMLCAALTGAVVAGASVLLLRGSAGGSPTTVSATASGAATGAGVRHDVSSGASGGELSATQIYSGDAAGVVAIRAVTADGEDTGTGIVLNDSGLILTNDHVIAEATQVTVSPGRSSSVTRAATLVGADPESDLALLKIDPSGLGLKPLKLANSSTVAVGDTVYAIGNPYGLDETLTKGIVSALGREIQAPDGAAIDGAIQTDAALNPGNSGGPLLNTAGEVIGINSQIASEQADTSGSQPGSTGVGFAIASNTAAKVIKQIESGGGGSGGAETQARARSAASEVGDGAGAGEAEADGPRARAGEPYGETETYAGGEGYEYGAGGSYGSGGRAMIVP